MSTETVVLVRLSGEWVPAGLLRDAEEAREARSLFRPSVPRS